MALGPHAMACPSLILQAPLPALASISNEFRIKNGLVVLPRARVLDPHLFPTPPTPSRG